MSDPVALEYLPRPIAPPPPAWVGRLGVASVVLGVVGVAAGVARARQAWEYAFDPSTKWFYPPPAWVNTTYFVAIVATLVVSVLLMSAGIVTLIRPATVFRVHAWYAGCKLPLVVIAAGLRAGQMWPHPDAPRTQLVLTAAFECAFFGSYAIFLLVFLGRKRATLTRVP